MVFVESFSMPQLSSPIAPEKKSNRIDWIDAAKGLSILLVVAYHANIIASSYEIQSQAYSLMSAVFQPVRMPLFFAISGFLASSIIHRSWRAVTRKKSLMYVYLFALWSIIHLAFFKYVAPHPSADLSDGLIETVISGFFKPQTGIWFIWALSFYFLLARALVSVPAFAVLLTVATSVVAFSPIVQPLGLNFAQVNALKYVPFFVLPAIYGMPALKRLSESIPVMGMLVVTLLAMFLAFRELSASLSIAAGMSAVLLNICGMIGGMMAAIVISQTPVAQTLFGYLGRNTLAIYLIHLLVIALTLPILERLSITSIHDNVAVPVLVIVSTGVSIFTAWCLKQLGAYWLFALPTRSADPSFARSQHQL
ncbi:acyltransferase family protein [Paracoccus sp. NFXS7]|uniref:acyltransferase family protein n=1 Tax=Paracoccus sp. NFXS7 TaxID=2908653 RepID=UPI0032DF5F0C